jgi:uncharacterized protein DUF6950
METGIIDMAQARPNSSLRAGAFGAAFDAAMMPFSWRYPCLLWLADYIKQVTGTDPAADWRGVTWDQEKAQAALARLAADAPLGRSDLEWVLIKMADRHGWQWRGAGEQGAEIGVHELDGQGFPSIRNPADGLWLLNATDGLRTTRRWPASAWGLVCA